MSDETMLDKPAKLLALCRLDLVCFVLAHFPGFEFARHLWKLVRALEAVERGEIKRLIVCLPPRHGKSLLISVFFVAWFLSRRPDREVIATSYGEELAVDFGRRVRNLIASPLNEVIFPDSRISNDSAAAHRFRTTRGGGYFAVGRGGPITGRGADLIVVDDPIKDREEANSQIIRKGIREWFADVLYTRLGPSGAIVVVQTRWHENDLAGWLQLEHANEGWVTQSSPAIAEHDEGWRREGEALWERFPLRVLESIKAQLGGAAFASLYQQRPAAAEGAIFRRSWWQSYLERPASVRTIQSWDTAYKKGETNDFSVCTTWAVAKDGFYLVDLWRGRVDFPELKRKVAELARVFNPHAILVEDKASGQSLIQELKYGSRIPIIPIKTDSDKITRAQAVTPLVEAGRVFIPERVGWRDDFVEEMAAFPVGSHDDIVDSTVQALAYLRYNDGGERDAKVISDLLDYMIADRNKRR